MEAIQETTELTQYLGFMIDGEQYAVEVLRVREIMEYGGVTRVPSTPAFIRGVINLRGAVVPVVDLAKKFGATREIEPKRPCIVLMDVLVDGEETVLGIVADSATAVMELAPADIKPPPRFGTQVQTTYLDGMGVNGEDFVLLLDIDRALSAREVAAALGAAQVGDDPGSEAVAGEEAEARGEAEAESAAETGTAVETSTVTETGAEAATGADAPAGAGDADGAGVVATLRADDAEAASAESASRTEEEEPEGREV